MKTVEGLFVFAGFLLVLASIPIIKHSTANAGTTSEVINRDIIPLVSTKREYYRGHWYYIRGLGRVDILIWHDPDCRCFANGYKPE